jgi:predicted amidohydrolase YtcJ
LTDGLISAIGSIQPAPAEPVLRAGGGLLLPGLNDHHIHFRAFARSLDSITCGPPAVNTAADLEALLRQQDSGAEPTWIRGVGYHERVAGEINRAWLDRVVKRRPIRIQHRSGRLWIMNSRAVELLVSRADALGQVLEGAEDGRFFDQDVFIGRLIGHQEGDLHRASRHLARLGITGFTDMTPANDTRTLADVAAWQASGVLLQQVLLAGRAELSSTNPSSGVGIGPTKFHLHDHSLPEFDEFVLQIRRSHQDGRVIAVHNVTELALVYTLSALRQAGVMPGDRVEHASVTPLTALPELRDLGLLVVTQPNFIAERGDQYRLDIPADQHDWLYRCASFAANSIDLAAGSDAPFGSPDPWAAMHTAVSRRTASGAVLGPSEAMTSEAALNLFLGSLEKPAIPRTLSIGAAADLCLLDRPWEQLKQDLTSGPAGALAVRVTICRGRLIYERVDQTPG